MYFISNFEINIFLSGNQIARPCSIQALPKPLSRAQAAACQWPQPRPLALLHPALPATFSSIPLPPSQGCEIPTALGPPPISVLGSRPPLSPNCHLFPQGLPLHVHPQEALGERARMGCAQHLSVTVWLSAATTSLGPVTKSLFKRKSPPRLIINPVI